jgi:dTMP kinase
MKKNLFIAFEGIDGSGKSTQVSMLAKTLSEAGHRVFCTAEPTQRPIGKMIREIFSGRQQADQRVIAGLFVADRLDHLLNEEDGIIHKLKEGWTVITDRYYLSSYAYHSVYMDMDWVIEANRLSAELLRPDINIFIDVSAEVSMQRINASRDSTEMYETLDQLKKVRSTYLKAIEKVRGEENISIFDGTKEPDTIAAQILEAVRTAGTR